MMHTSGMTWDGVSEFYEDDEPLDRIREVLARPVDATTAMPVNAPSVAAEILSQTGPIDAMKLQKLCYYAQVQHLVQFDVPLYPDAIEAWAAGPVVRSVYALHRRQYSVSALPGADPVAARQHPTAMEAIRATIARYGLWSGQQLSELTHREDPWRDARGDLPPTARSDAEIDTESMRSYYKGLLELPTELDDEDPALV